MSHSYRSNPYAFIEPSYELLEFTLEKTPPKYVSPIVDKAEAYYYREPRRIDSRSLSGRMLSR